MAVTLLFAVALTAALVITRPSPQPTCQRVVIASSAEKFGLLRDFAAIYNRTEGKRAARCVTVAVEQVNSGDAELALEQGWRGQSTERPDVWAPASSAWVNLLAKRSNGSVVLPGNYYSLFKSPLVIGMPEPMAAALGYPGKRLGWKDIFALVKNPAGWSAFGHPQWGQFRFGKTNPTVSTSGLHALIGTYFTASGGTTITMERVTNARDFVAGVEAGVVHYAQTAGDFLRNLRDAADRGAGPALLYASAVAVEEQELVDYNAGIIGGVAYGSPSVFLVPIYPDGGTPVADHPYVVLNQSRTAAAEDFHGFLVKPEQQAVIDSRGFRTVGSVDRGEVGPVLSLQRFIDRTQPALVVQPPQGSVLDAMLAAWQTLRKRARVLILVDAAANSDLLKLATTRLAEAVSRFNPTDSAGVWVFPAPAGYTTPYTELVPVARVSAELKIRLANIVHTTDRSAVGPSLKAAVNWMAASYDPGAVDAVLLVEMSPGERTVDDQVLEQYLRNQPVDHFVRVFTIGPDGPPSQRLQLFARAGLGVAYQPGSASHLLTDVISNF